MFKGIVTGLVVVGALVVSVEARAASCTVPSIATAQPVDNGTLKVSRIAGAHAGAPDQWDMRYDAWLCNPSAAAYTVTSAKIEHLTGTKVTHTVTQTPIAPASVDAGASSQLVMVRDDSLYAFPLPTSVRVTLTLSTGGTIVKSYPVAEHINPGPLHAYFFPMRQADLPANAYWLQTRHTEDNNFQRYAYDLTVQQWNGSSWIYNKPGTDGTHKADSFTFDQPVYAMSDGIVIGCNRGAPDNDPADKQGNVPGGNLLWIRTGNETQLYAHLHQGSISESLCPFTDDAEHKLGDPSLGLDAPANAKYRVHAGQLVAHTGTSGFSRSGGSHLHIHTFMGLPHIWGGSETGLDADARPLEFVNVRVQEIADGNVSASAWNDVTSRHLLPYNTRIEPNLCGFDPSAAAGKPEVVNVAVPGNCFLEMLNAMWQAGDTTTYIDVHGTGASSNSATVWRPGNNTAVLAGLSAAEIDAAKHTWVTINGYRILQIETYAEGGVVKYAILFIKGPTGGAQFMQLDMSEATLQTVFNTQTAAGYVPVNISAATVGNVTKYAALFEKKSVGSVIAKAKIAIADYQAEFDANSKAGRGLAYIDGYDIGGKAFVSAIWYGTAIGTSAFHGQTKAQILTDISAAAGAGRLTRGITEYDDAGLKYAGFWR